MTDERTIPSCAFQEAKQSNEVDHCFKCRVRIKYLTNRACSLSHNPLPRRYRDHHWIQTRTKYRHPVIRQNLNVSIWVLSRQILFTSRTMIVRMDVLVSRSRILTYPSWHPAAIISPLDTRARTAPCPQSNSWIRVGVWVEQLQSYLQLWMLKWLAVKIQIAHFDFLIATACRKTHAIFVI